MNETNVIEQPATYETTKRGGVGSGDLLAEQSETVKYQIEIIETLSRVVEVEADSAEEAREKIKQKYRDGEIILTADNANADYEINTL